MYSVHYTHCKLIVHLLVHYTLYIVGVHCTLYMVGVHCTLYTVQCTVYNVPTMYSVNKNKLLTLYYLGAHYFAK